MGELSFVKLQGTGNDFVILDERSGESKEWAAPGAEPPGVEVVRALCDRHTGVGADGVVLLDARDPAAPRFAFFNPDGSPAEMCGNGLRCAAHYLHAERGLPAQLVVTTAVGPRVCQVELGAGSRRAQVQVEMGVVAVSALAPRVRIDEHDVVARAVQVGNPHLVLLRAPVGDELQREGPRLSHHPAFAHGTNVEWVEVLGQGHARAWVFERGAGPTLACGSGACAVAATLVATGHASHDEPIAIDLPGGRLIVRLDAQWRAWLTGPSVLVFRGRFPRTLE